MTTIIVSTLPTTSPDPCSEIEYFTLDDDTRSKNYGRDSFHSFCDNFGREQSPDWHGPNWYRMLSPAGSMIPETVVEDQHCNSFMTGWLNGTHPAMLDETVTRTVCFNWLGNTCYHETEIQIRNCGDYLLYYLPNTPICYDGVTIRYCSE